jgi:multisubunit Na+/H+ antiporter MnhC subunit
MDVLVLFAIVVVFGISLLFLAGINRLMEK